MEALIEASRILYDARIKVAHEPTPIFLMVDHALSYVNKQLDAEMRGN